MANVLVRIDVEDQAAAALDGVTVRVYQADGTTFITEGTTGAPFATGRVEFTLFGDVAPVSYVLRFSINGYYFPAGAAQTIGVTDPPNPDNDFGPYTAQQGSTAVLVTLNTIDQQSPAQPIQSVLLRIYDAGDTFLTEVTTDALGVAVVPLPGSATPGTDYIVRAWKDGVSFVSPTTTISVEDPLVPPNLNSFDFIGDPEGPFDSADPDMCTVYGDFVDLSLTPARSLRLVFKPCVSYPEVGLTTVGQGGRFLGSYYSQPTLVRGNILTRDVVVDTDPNGHFEVELPRGGYFEVHVRGFEDPIEITERIYIPDQASVAFQDILWPYITAITYGTDPIAVGVDSEVTVTFTLTLSSGETLTDLELVQDLIEFAPADDTIATVTLSSATELTVRGEAVGSTTIVASRKSGTTVPTRPDLAALTVTPPTVNVS